jgi:Zn-dependent peptidase ImmA (M78 family)
MNGKAGIWAAAEELRQQHAKDLGNVPVDVLTTIEVRLRLDVVPFENLLTKYSVDAALMQDFSGIYVDKASYRYLEGRPLYEFNRLRFSLAHELGHCILHRKLTGESKFKTLDDFRNWMKSYNDARYSLEWEANEFAGRLLMSPITSKPATRGCGIGVTSKHSTFIVVAPCSKSTSMEH